MIYLFLQFMLHCIHFKHYIEQLDLEYVCNDKLVHLDKHNIRLYTSASI